MTHEEAMQDDFQVPNHVKLDNDPPDIKEWIEKESEAHSITIIQGPTKWEQKNQIKKKSFEAGATAMHERDAQEIAELNKTIFNIEANNEQLQQNMADNKRAAKAMHDDLQNRISELKTKIEKLEEQRKFIQDIMRNEIAELKKENEELKKQYDDLNGQYDSLNSSYQSLQPQAAKDAAIRIMIGKNLKN